MQLQSCIPSLERNRRVDLSDEAIVSESDVLDRHGNPDEIFGPIINAYGESVAIWFYHAKGSVIQDNSVWIYMVDRKYVKSTIPGDWPKDSAAIYSTRFRNWSRTSKPFYQIKTSSSWGLSTWVDQNTGKNCSSQFYWWEVSFLWYFYRLSRVLSWESPRMGTTYMSNRPDNRCFLMEKAPGVCSQQLHTPKQILFSRIASSTGLTSWSARS